MSAERLGLALAGVSLAAALKAQDADETESNEELADADFLEYLGSWDGSDEEWTWFEDERAAQATDNDETAVTESNDES